MRIAINGFGRIGKTFLKALLEDKAARSKIKVVAINIGPNSLENVPLLFKHDSVYGCLPHNVTLKGKKLIVDKVSIDLLAEPDIKKINWKKFKVDWVVECSGRFTKREGASLHLKSGAKNVLISAPAQDEDVQIIPGVNMSAYNPKKHKIVSLGSCTTNCFAPIIKIISENFTFQHGLMTTTHAYTSSQSLVDDTDTDLRRLRAAAINMVPTTTGADKAIVKVFPELGKCVQSSAVRVPLPIVSLLDFSFQTKEKLSPDQINKAFIKAAKSKELRGIVCFSNQPLVSSDYIKSPYSAIIDGLMTRSCGNLGKLFAWYDNEWGYSCRLREFLLHIS